MMLQYKTKTYRSYTLDKVAISCPYYKYHPPCVGSIGSIGRIQQREVDISRDGSRNSTKQMWNLALPSIANWHQIWSLQIALPSKVPGFSTFCLIYFFFLLSQISCNKSMLLQCKRGITEYIYKPRLWGS